jgi:Cdc6-like AAA superfamily ATPase
MIWFVRHKLKKINKIFRPAAPIKNPAMLIGRDTKKAIILDSVQSPGVHLAIFGSRGVGKTSILNIVSQELDADNYDVCMHTCSYKDNYESIFGTLFDRSGVAMKVEGKKVKTSGEAVGKIEGLILKSESKVTREQEITYTPMANIPISPNFIADHFQKQKIVFVIDEYDRIGNIDTKTLIAETIKCLADREASLKIILSGVSAKGNDLVGVHPSTIRNIIPVEITTLDNTDLERIIKLGAAELGLTFSGDVIKTIVFLSDGLPYFTHLLAQKSSLSAVRERISNITMQHLTNALPDSISLISEEISSEFNRAVTNRVYFDTIDDEFISPPNLKTDLIKELCLLVLSITKFDRNNKAYKIFQTFEELRNTNRIFLPDSMGKIEEVDILSTLHEIASYSDIIFEKNDSFYFKDPYHKAYVSILTAKKFGPLLIHELLLKV